MVKQQGPIRFGVVGLGNMGMAHVGSFNNLRGAQLAAACDASTDRLNALPANVKRFTSCDAMFDSGLIDAVIVAVPHFAHVPVSISAFQKGLHVLCEKPLAVSISEARKLVAVAEAHPELAFGVVHQLRTYPMFKSLRKLITDGDLGEITRITWIATDWFRSHAYYRSGGWRATWKGEGGGMLINQCPHNFDMLQWVTGLMPSRITAVGFAGKRHPIEVEDEVSAILEYDTGAIGHFIATTGEAPGSNRLEIAGDRGKVIVENGTITLYQTAESVQHINATTSEGCPQVASVTHNIAFDPEAVQGECILLQNFVDHLNDGQPLISPGKDGLNGLEIGNAMTMAALTRRPVELPLDGQRFDAFLQAMQDQAATLTATRVPARATATAGR